MFAKINGGSEYGPLGKKDPTSPIQLVSRPRLYDDLLQ